MKFTIEKKDNRQLKLTDFTINYNIKRLDVYVDGLYIDFSKCIGWSFYIKNNTQIKIGSYSAIVGESYNMIEAGYKCNINVIDHCILNTCWGCSFIALSNNTFKTGSNCKFEIVDNCQVYTGSNCIIEVLGKSIVVRSGFDSNLTLKYMDNIKAVYLSPYIRRYISVNDEFNIQTNNDALLYIRNDDQLVKHICKEILNKGK